MWSHKKYKKFQFTGKYVKAGTDRVFQLSSPLTHKPITYESWQAAKKDGWIKQ